MAEHGYDVTLLAAFSKTKMHDMGLRVVGIPVRKVPFLSYLVLEILMIPLLPLLVLKLRPNFLIVEPELGSFFSIISTRVIPRPLRPRIVMDIRTTPIETRGLRGMLENLCFLTAVHLARELLDGVTTITNMMKQEICAKFHLDPKAVRVWTSGVSTDRFAPDATMRKKMRKRLELNGKFVIMYHGAVTANRGISQAISSMSLLNGKYDNAVLFVLGKGPALSDLKSTSREKAAKGRVIFHEPVDFSRVPSYLSACDIGIIPLPNLPDWRNQCPLNLLECLSMGKVVIATDIPANREVAGKSKCVIYAASSDSKSITRAIIHAFDNRNKLGEWGATGRALMEEKYEWSKVAQSLERYLSYSNRKGWNETS